MPLVSSLLAIVSLFTLFTISSTFAKSTIIDGAYFLNGNISDSCATYVVADGINKKIRPLIQDLTTKTDYFAYYKLNLFDNECPFWSDGGEMCGNRACAEEIPEIWRSQTLGKLSGPTPSQAGSSLLNGDHPFGPHHVEACIVENDFDTDRDYCIPEDESDQSKGVYVSLVDNPERFTGYAGLYANKVWNAIYQENCFEYMHNSKTPSPNHHPFEDGLEAVVMGWNHRIQANLEGDVARQAINNEAMCFEKRVFWRMMSGMHASISAHLCWEYLNQFTGQWGSNLECFQQRLGSHPEWIENLYFNYALVLRAFTKLSRHIEKYTFCEGDLEQNKITKDKVLTLAQLVQSVPQTFNESLMFDLQTRTDALQLKEDFRSQFRNVSRLMDCVGCDKCRLWGKLQVAGYGTALKVLFEFNENGVSEVGHYHLRRTELVSLVNLLARLSTSTFAVQEFTSTVRLKSATPEKKDPVSSITKNTKSQKSSKWTRIENALTNNWFLRMYIPSVKDRLLRWLKPHLDDLDQSFRQEASLLVKAIADVLGSIVVMPGVLYQNIIHQMKSFLRWALLGPEPSRAEL